LVGVSTENIENSMWDCNAPIPQVRGRYSDVHTQDGDTLTYVR